MARLDLDDGRPPGLYGEAMYFAPGAPDSPCEAGGCVVLEGTSTSCDAPAYTGEPGVLALRLDVPPEHRISTRCRVFADDPVLLQSAFDHAGMGFGGDYVRTTALPAPDGPYTYATEWQTVDDYPALGPSTDMGFVIGPACRYHSGSPTRTRVVVEWVELTPVPPRP